MQEQAISLVQNLVYGDTDSVQHLFADNSVLLYTVEKQLFTSRPQINYAVQFYSAALTVSH